MPVGSRQIRTDHNHRDCHACPQRASDSNSCVVCAASALDCRDSLVPGRQNRRPAKRISKLGEISIALILDHDSVPDGGCDAHLRGHILPRSELDLGMALEELGEFEKSIRRSLAFLCRNSASPLCFGERTAGDCLSNCSHQGFLQPVAPLPKRVLAFHPHQAGCGAFAIPGGKLPQPSKRRTTAPRHGSSRYCRHVISSLRAASVTWTPLRARLNLIWGDGCWRATVALTATPSPSPTVHWSLR